MNTYRLILVAVLLMGFSFACSNSDNPMSNESAIISSTFDGVETDGWTLLLGSISNPGSGGNGGGDGNGYLQAVVAFDGETSYYVAPEAYHRNWTRFRELYLDLRSSGGTYNTTGYGMYGDIFLANGQLTAQRLLDHRPPPQWETFVIPLIDDGNWTLGGGTTNLSEVLSNVTDFQIRAEFGVGADESSLDNVKLL